MLVEIEAEDQERKRSLQEWRDLKKQKQMEENGGNAKGTTK